MTDTYTAHDVSDVLNALPTLFGFRPYESLVAVATHGPRRRFGFRMRVDLPHPDDADQLGRLVAGHLRHQGAEGAILVAVTEQQDVARELLSAVRPHLAEIELVLAVRADKCRYWLDVPDFPERGIAYEVSDHHLAIVKAVAAGQQILPDRAALVARFAPVQDPRRAELLRATMAVVPQVIAVIADSPDDGLVDLAFRAVEDILDRGLSGLRLSDDDIVLLSVWVSTTEVRDAVVSLMTRDNAPAMLSLFTLLAQNVVPPCEPAVLTLAAFAAWLTGDGAQALIAVERALDVAPDYGAANTLIGILEAGIAPERWFAIAAEER
ncbi:hypothetical protein GCM10022234_34340 [Aeromicrobium panaciterrae]|uniref:DUF4192 domain-containing protein n=1 Tax=Aeromicrobium panaciterrae TaxID=363861 RepID=UPI0031D3F00D